MGNKFSLLVYQWPLLNKKKMVYELIYFSKFAQFWAQNWLKLWKHRVILLTIWPKIRSLGIWMSLLFFLTNLYGSTFKFRGGTSLTNQTWVPPLRELLCYATSRGGLTRAAYTQVPLCIELHRRPSVEWWHRWENSMRSLQSKLFVLLLTLLTVVTWCRTQWYSFMIWISHYVMHAKAFQCIIFSAVFILLFMCIFVERTVSWSDECHWR